ncbi:PREDICTED: dimethyladenosine transferase 2, mitochondrial [Chinchilla lanigera]|uniref:rRNA adenine N(6)-methyltransferase n=1 Tax=Chinchilla lanigera TaxID=34839 RepID=A0A8C2VBH1_CHILA|nr:PREDICTED: dimethyladenosine transferase 2, mitochondrial [Chinchilla lanigera]
MWRPATVLPPRWTLSVFPGASRFCFWRLGAAMRKDLGDVLRRGLSDSCPQPLRYEDLRVFPRLPFDRSVFKRSITSPRLAETLAEVLQLGKNARRGIIIECNPGPGFLTKALLETGASVIALESHKKFIPHLQSLGEKLNRKLEVVHCDFFKMDPTRHNLVRPPIVLSQELFPSLGIEANSWLEDTPFKVVGMLPMSNEKKALWKLLHDLYTCSSIYRYGRVELYMLISESQFEKLIANPTNPYLYHVLSVLWQVSCEIKLLHKASLKHRNVCFIQMTPRKNLFTEYLTPINYDIFFHMVKQCFGRRRALVIQHLHSLTPYDPLTIMNEANIETKVKPSDIYPQDFKNLFETIERSSDDDNKWLYDRVIEDLQC